MQQVSRNLIILAVLAVIASLASALLHAKEPLPPRTQVLKAFPLSLGPYLGEDIRTTDADELRQAYQPAQLVFRNYAVAGGPAIELFVGPTLVGWHSPAVCYRYIGWEVSTPETIEVDRQRAFAVNFTTGSHGSQNIGCAYYWRRGESAIVENSFPFWRHSLASLWSSDPDTSFEVEACVRGSSDAIERSKPQILELVRLADPELVKLYHAATSASEAEHQSEPPTVPQDRAASLH